MLIPHKAAIADRLVILLPCLAYRERVIGRNSLESVVEPGVPDAAGLGNRRTGHHGRE